jgi:ribokinase
MGFQVICLGAVNVDLLYEVADLEIFLKIWPQLEPGGEVALDPEAEVRLQGLLGRHARPAGRHGGGQAANTAFALACMGMQVALVGRVGADADGVFLKDSLAGVNLDYLVSEGVSGRAYVLLDSRGERTILVAPNTNDDLKQQDIPWEALAAARFVHLTSFVGQGPFLLQEEVARRLEGGPRLSFDPGELYARRGWPGLERILDYTETLLVTEREWELLGGDLEQHPYWAPPLILIKRGPKGARLLTPVRFLDFHAGPVSGLVDTLGAGDVFAAGYLAGRLNGLNLPGCVRLAGWAAAYKLSGPGRERYPDRRFLEKVLRELRY